MKLIDLLTPGKEANRIPKSEIPSLIGELKTVKARLWVRLTEREKPEPILASEKKTERETAVEKPPKPIQVKPIPGPQGRILRLNDVVQLLGLSKSTIWNLHRERRFPRLVRLGPRSVGWRDTEIHEWIDGRRRG